MLFYMVPFEAESRMAAVIGSIDQKYFSLFQFGDWFNDVRTWHVCVLRW